MTRLTSRLVTICGVAGIGLTLSLTPVSAQPGWGGMGGMWGMGAGGMMCNLRAGDFTDRRIARIERLVRPTDDQKPKLDELRKAWAKSSEIMQAACPKEIPETPVARMELMEKRLAAMSEAIKVVRPAYAAFYESLTPEQQRRLNLGGPGRGMGMGMGWGWRR